MTTAALEPLADTRVTSNDLRRPPADRQLFAALRPALVRFFGKGGAALVDSTLALIRDAYSSLIDVTAAATARSGSVVRPEFEEVFT
jgi:hypothetical protein